MIVHPPRVSTTTKFQRCAAQRAVASAAALFEPQNICESSAPAALWFEFQGLRGLSAHLCVCCCQAHPSLRRARARAPATMREKIHPARTRHRRLWGWESTLHTHPARLSVESESRLSLSGIRSSRPPPTRVRGLNSSRKKGATRATPQENGIVEQCDELI
jgi:hypothetical protein